MHLQPGPDFCEPWTKVLRTLTQDISGPHPQTSAKVEMTFCGLAGMTTGAQQPMKRAVEAVHMLEASGRKAPLKQHTATQLTTYV